MYSACILDDSINIKGNRLVTMDLNNIERDFSVKVVLT